MGKVKDVSKEVTGETVTSSVIGRAWSDHWVEEQGRLATPIRYDLGIARGTVELLGRCSVSSMER